MPSLSIITQRGPRVSPEQWHDGSSNVTEMQNMDFDDFTEVWDLILHYCASNWPFTSESLERDVQSKSALWLPLLFMTSFLFSLNIGFILFRRQRKQLMNQLQCFLRGTHRLFLHIQKQIAAKDTQAATAFLYLTADEFPAWSGLAKDIFSYLEVATSQQKCIYRTPLPFSQCRPHVHDSQWLTTQNQPFTSCCVWFFLKICFPKYFHPVLFHWRQHIMLSLFLNSIVFLPQVCAAGVLFTLLLRM